MALFRKIFLIGILLTLGLMKNVFATQEPYINELKGPNVVVGNSFIVADEKFGTGSSFTKISLDDIVSFEINFDTSVYFYNQPFNCTVNFKIYIYDNASDTSEISDSTTHASINLQIQYDTITGKPYKGIALYKFKDAYKYRVKILSITCPQQSPILPIFRLKGEIIVDRKYNFSDNSSDVTHYAKLSGSQLKLDWTPSNYLGAEMFDLEYTHIDSLSKEGSSIRSFEGASGFMVPEDSLAKWFKNNNTRITTSSSNYLLNVPYDSGYILFRIRGVQIHQDGIRWEGNWNYSATGSSCTSGCPSGVVFFEGHETSLNWQYSVTFAEEGKKKEVVSYFDGSLRNRQSITINSTDNKSIVQESIYDVLGRPTVNILPVPTDDSTLHYFRGFNKNTGGNPYSFSDISNASCVVSAAPMDTSSGASKYYSPNNQFLNSYSYARYIPDAHTYPFAVTQYVADNTGRIITQGGVDTTFQIGHGHETNYFYGKPTQTELDRLFGSEAGNASHYLKNMVVDPNGQISVSYVDASGKTVATALAGSSPVNLHALPSSVGAIVQMNDELMSPRDFSANSNSYTISSSATILAPVTGTYVLSYEVDPLEYQKLYGPQKDSVICSTCYYDLLITVKDNCENILKADTLLSSGNEFDTTCANGTAITGTLNVDINKIGEYYVYYQLKVSTDALDFYDSVHIVKNSDIKKLNNFLLDELKQTDFYGCYSNCETCKAKLGAKDDFYILFQSLYVNDSVSFNTDDSTWVLSLYDSLYANCLAIQSECTHQNVCDIKLDLLKIDVSPGGQYGLYDTGFVLLERPINRLDTAWRHKISCFPDENGNPDSITLHTIEGEDSVRIPVNRLNDSMFIANWKDSWADSLVKLHPEYCNYLWCTTNSNSYDFDKQVEDWQDADTVTSIGWFNPGNYYSLLEHDPFFASGGLGESLYNRMKDSLRLFSRTKIRFASSDKNLLQFVDIVLYCNNQSFGWDDCHPDSACRSRNREWFLYKELYLNLKQRFYEEAKRTSTNPVFANCSNCFIGRDLLNIINPLGCDDLTSLVDSFNLFRSQIDFNDVFGNKRITQSAKELVHSANALVEARSTYPSPSFTEDYCYDGTSLSTYAKLHAVRYYALWNYFNTIAPLSLKSNALFPLYPDYELRNNPVVDSDFCTGVRNPELTSDDYYAVNIQGRDSVFMVDWSFKNYISFGYYGTASPELKFLPDSAEENQSFLFGFIRMNGTYPDYSSYSSARLAQQTIHLDSVLHVKNLRFATEKLPPGYNSISDNYNFGYLNVSLAMKDGSTIDAHLVAGYEGTPYVLYKQQIDSNEYNSDCQTAFSAWFNNRKGTHYSSGQIDSIYQATCGKSPLLCTRKTLFADSTCNYHCAAGIHDPYDRDSISFYIEYGKPDTAPSGTPAGYGGRQFYSIFDLKTGPSSSCKFLNVWVCIYDSTCPGGGVCHFTESFASQCTGTGTDTLYQNKIRRYPEYVNTDEFIKSMQSDNLQQSSAENAQQILDECHSNCVAQADYWINTLKRCNLNSSDSIALKAALIDICSKGCAQSNVFGTSTLPDTTSATYHSFEEAIIGILGPGAINDSCTAELLSNPYPYNRLPVNVDRVITQSDYDICHKLAQRKQSYQSSGYTGSFHQWLTKTFGSSYTLDSAELDDLMNSCSNCNGILKNDIVLPVLFDPQSSDCLHCDSLQATLVAFQNKFPSIDSSKENYEILFTNFFNHHLGYSLIYNQYKTFLDSCTANTSYSAFLCNEPTVTTSTDSTGGANGCVNEQFATALTNATNTYIVYIDSVHKDFRDAWMTKCLNVQPSLKMSADLYEYHYTLYYYDQSGNLVKTIPPEGVNLLDSASIDTVKYIRLLKNEGCYKYSDSILFNNNGKIEWPIPAFEANPYTVEMVVNLTSHSDQVIASKLTEYTVLTQHPHAGFIIQVVGNKLEVDLYDHFAGSEDTSIAVSSLNISSLIPTGKWTHLAVEQTGNLSDPLRIFINGQAISFSYTVNNLSGLLVPGLSGTSPLIVGSHDALHLSLPGMLRGTIKNLRIYNRQLTTDELRQNAFNPCQTPSNSLGLLFWSALNNATSDSVTEIITRTKGILSGFTWAATEGKFPAHRLATTYQYNSLNQVLQQYSPDGDTSQFFYDRLGRLIVSQNKEQKENSSYNGSSNRFSFTQYDQLGRIKVVGEKSSPSDDIRNIDLLDTTAVKNWIASGTDRQITKTIYDDAINLSFQNISTSRKRVTASIYLENKNDLEGDSTLYNYDILGNVNTLVQHIKALVAADGTNGKKRIDYDYDLVSGKVNMVSYQPGKGDQFFYKYSYDADNRVISSYSSRDKLIWTEDASYNYYLHGPLARTELGNYKVQGVDYAYTLQGWLKGINSDSLAPISEMGSDGWPNRAYSRVSRDVYAFKLGYYNHDYTPIGGSTSAAFNNKNYTAPASLDNSGNPLFNGNISTTTLALSKINSGSTIGYSYGYDQLNRLVEMRQHSTGATSGWSNSNIITAYRESIAYDANGNILKYLRNGTSAMTNMDSLNYKYNRDGDGNIVNNKLNYVKDQVSSSNYAVDIDDQAANNYRYDLIGNLKKDTSEGIDTVRWTVYGKINKIVKNTGGININYGYDAGGNRTTKIVSGSADTTTFYVRDAQGNVLAVYTKKGVDDLHWDEQDLYGSSRLGLLRWDTIVPTSPPVVDESPIYDSLMLGNRTYELTNHLGNVLSTISDKKIGNDSSGVVNYYLAEVLSQNDYFPFGMMMPGRQFSSNRYRYGFNGKEDDNEVSGEGNKLNFGFRIFDPRLGKWLSVDPEAHHYPGISPYAYAVNTPLSAVDPDGRLIIFIGGLRLWVGQRDQRGNQTPETNNAYRGIYNYDIFKYWADDKTTNTFGRKVDMAANFINRINDKNAWFTSGSSAWTSQADYRIEQGKEKAQEFNAMVQNGKIKLAKDESIKIVSHSQGGAFSEGFAEQLLTYKDKEGKPLYKIEVIYFITPSQPEKFSFNIPGAVGVQYSHPSDAVASKAPWWLPNGGSKYAKIIGINSENFAGWDIMGGKGQPPAEGPNGNRSGHNVTDNDYIFDIPKGSPGYVAPRKDVPKSTEN